MSIGVIWCDFGGVLTPPIREAMASIAAASGVPWAALSAAASAVAEEQGMTGFQPLELGVMTQRDWGASLSRRLAPDHVSRVDLGEWGDHWYRGRVVNAALLDELERLACDGVRVGMLTNSVREWEPHRERMLIGRSPFEAVVRSHELGIAKPDSRIFTHCERNLVSAGGTTLLIDDSPANCSAAEKHGWNALLHVDTVTTISRLRTLHAQKSVR